MPGGDESIEDHAIILFDGVCNFCSAAVEFIIRHDKQARFRFAPLQSAAGAEIQRRYHLDPNALDTLVLVENGRAHLKSGAALRVGRGLGGVYPLLYAFILMPPFVRDLFYDWFARRRYRWFGKKDECMVPAGEVRSRFLID